MLGFATLKRVLGTAGFGLGFLHYTHAYALYGIDYIQARSGKAMHMYT
jgi:hypothetical protein